MKCSSSKTMKLNRKLKQRNKEETKDKDKEM